MSTPFDDDPFRPSERAADPLDRPDLDPDSVESAAEDVLAGWRTTTDTDLHATHPHANDPSHDGPLLSDPPASEEDPVRVEAAPELPHTEDSAPIADHVSAEGQHAAGELIVPPGYPVLDGIPRGERRAVGIVVSRFNGEITSKLLASALAELDRRGVIRDAITVMPVPGAFELPVAAMALAKTRRFACIVALGCVIRGDTPHFDYVAAEAASGLQLAAIETGVPVAFGVLTLESVEQAAGRLEKGAEAVLTALEMADVFSNLRAAAAR
ncbi:MAG: 6,7-dimethyl-8-ribityllumazine synthase [Gaiella sp.]